MESNLVMPKSSKITKSKPMEVRVKLVDRKTKEKSKNY